ncbi:hypothetical protein [Lacticaseibacillus paracasei]|uniref:hypothetical protein n=1 Tax=Lacticaseibacillus paracasei TaxID=1597 RepID=UPI0021A7F882|nr:hypothetical protein [Lacticaseibacillus paracasei]MCT4386500.1 hypothetical protein [Lacticaseibacillus paracasei]
MNCKLGPIIGRDKFEMPLFVRQGAGMILASSPDFDTEVRQLSQLLRQLLLDDRYLNEADAKKEKIQNYYNWNTVADRILQFFLQLVLFLNFFNSKDLKSFK